MHVMASWGILVIACALVAVVLSAVVRTVLRDRGIRLSPSAGHTRAACARCLGEGELALLWDEQADGTTWQPPVDDHGRIRSGINRANVKDCPACAGLGYHWT